ncbi:recombinase family protein [Cyanobacterium aponinum AL20118]|uniref:Recombinase family protein n=1 Tax=Cyanobacterium aponinum AL20115 TaxID=3090662 RepID=A0AAF0ZC26_9CHRO|nr:recombinase family protein [Cyanobacterium aponinum]WPF87553.1 recombinase family protein [Cyanobacterium aponinum AL20115]
MIYGYARVSTIEQTTAPQQLELQNYGCDKILLEHGVSGSVTDRDVLRWLLDNLREGDTVVVVRLDRLGRSLKHLLETIDHIHKVGANFISLAEGMDTTTPTGKLLFSIFGAIAEFERNLIIDRVNAGIKSAQARGVHCGHPYKLNAQQVDLLLELKLQGKSPKQIQQLLNISKATYYRYLERLST